MTTDYDFKRLHEKNEYQEPENKVQHGNILLGDLSGLLEAYKQGLIKRTDMLSYFSYEEMMLIVAGTRVQKGKNDAV